jgi:hypothetical protein
MDPWKKCSAWKIPKKILPKTYFLNDRVGREIEIDRAERPTDILRQGSSIRAEESLGGLQCTRKTETNREGKSNAEGQIST